MCKGDLFDWSMYKYYTIMRLNENKVIDMMFPVHFWVSKTVLKQKASSPVSVQYLVQILRGWKKKKKNEQRKYSLGEGAVGVCRQRGALLQRVNYSSRGLGLKAKGNNWNDFSVVLTAETSQRPQTLYIPSLAPEAPIHSHTGFKLCSCSLSNFHNALCYCQYRNS